MKNKNTQDWLKDYEDFLKFDELQVPANLKDQTYLKITKLLNPSAYFVFVKILAFHLVIGFLSLSVCHQFGTNPFNTKMSLDNWMMQIGGHSFCMIGCGVLFVGSSLLGAGYFLTVEEINALRKTAFLQNLALGLISLGLFTALGAELAFGIAGLWLLGALLGGFAATETVWQLKQSKT